MVRRRKRGLTSDDLDVWSRVTRTLTPIAPDKLDVEISVTPSKPKTSGPALTSIPLPRSETAIKAPKISIDLTPDPIQALRDAPSQMDGRTYDRLRKGKLEPERRIDLHGQTLNVAERALISFIMSSRAQGCRVVLVITGKGRTKPIDDGPIPRRPGAIRANLMRWLSSPQLGDAVVQVMPAQDRHGGTGAFYVYLRRQR